MRSTAKFFIPVVVVFLTLSLAAAQGPGIDVEGAWNLEMVAFVPGMAGITTRLATPDCTFEGSVTIEQDGADITGDALVQLTDGSMLCPSVMTGHLTGTVDGNEINMGMMMGGGGLGQADFSGAAEVVPKTLKRETATRGILAMPDVINGEYIVASGPFAGTEGGFVATRSLAEEEVNQIPTLNSLGLLVFAATLVGAGILVIQRFRHS